jgi:MFS family permease
MFLMQMGLKGAPLHTWSGAVFALPAIAAILLQPYWMKLGDKYGRKPMVIRAGICLASIYFLMSFSKNPLQLAVCRLLNGGLTGFIPGSIALIATNTPKDEAPRSLAVAQSASAIGQIAGPSIGLMMVLIAGGYRGSMRVSGAAVAISTLLVYLMVREPNKVVITEQTSMLHDVRTAFRHGLISTLMVPVFMEGAFATAVLSQLALHLPRLVGQAPRWYVGIIYAGPAMAMAGTVYVWSRVGERIGYTRTLHIGLIGTALASLSLTFVRSIWVFLPVYFIAGVFLASIFPSMAALLVTKVETQFQARAYGVLASMANLGGFLAPMVAGWLAAVYGTQYVFTFMGALFLSGSFLFPIMLRRAAQLPELETEPELVASAVD